MERACTILGCLFGAQIALAAAPPDSARAAGGTQPPAHGTDSVAPASAVPAKPDSVIAAGAPLPAPLPPRPAPFLIPSLGWTFGVGAPVFPFRDRFVTELSALSRRDTMLVVDQPWDGSQLGFGTGCELGLQHGFFRGVLGAEWTFWDSRSVTRNRGTGSLMERTWRVDQLMGLAGFDLVMARRLLTVAGATDPYFGFRAAYGVGRLVGLGRAWAYGGGMQMHLGADVASYGPIVIGGRMGWNSLSLGSRQSTGRVLYDGGTSEDISWNGSGLWLNFTIRLRPTPAPPDTTKAPPPRRRTPEVPEDSARA